jgi:hypothetical protein
MTNPVIGPRCRWAEPTLFMASPFWFAAEEYPWSCHRDAVPRPIADTAACRECERFAPLKPRIRLLAHRKEV